MNAALLPSCTLAASACAASQAGGAAAAMAFHIGETTVSFPLRAEEAQRLSGALVGIMQVFADKQKAERPQRWAALEYVFRGEAGSGHGTPSGESGGASLSRRIAS